MILYKAFFSRGDRSARDGYKIIKELAAHILYHFFSLYTYFCKQLKANSATDYTSIYLLPLNRSTRP